MNFFKRFLCLHEWKKNGAYTSIKDTFSGNDRSGDIYEFQQCTCCEARRICHKVIDKNGTVKEVFIR